MNKSTATLKSISATLGISISTVSRVLNDRAKKYRISDATVAKIKKEADRVSFAPNQIASALRSQKTKTIALVIPDISNSYFSSMAKGLGIEARKAGYSLLLFDSLGQEKLEIEAVRLMRSRKVDGFIIAPASTNGQHIIDLKESGTPVVFIDRYIKSMAIASVCSDNVEAAYQATSYLITSGHQHIACIQGLNYLSSSADRTLGYKKALAKYHLAENKSYFLGDDFSHQSGYAATKILLENCPQVTAILSLSHLNAMGAMQAIKEAGKHIPEDISLITFDDDPLFAYLSTPLTSVDQPNEAIGIETMQLLIAQINGESNSTEQKLLKTQLILRDSVKVFNKDSEA
ncbi:MAG: LacI family transcriptional regulator [Colwellia sp.]|nr:LacI family transcriptional regulator [Colwellia sp.]